MKQFQAYQTILKLEKYVFIQFRIRNFLYKANVNGNHDNSGMTIISR